MIASAKPGARTQAVPPWHEAFLAMLPTIQKCAGIAFRHLDPEARADAVEEVVANALVAYVRLVELGKADLAYATPLAMYGIRQFRAGRRVGTKANVNDITSPWAKAAKGIHVGRLDHRNKGTRQWKEILIEDRRAGPAETAASRIDFASWLGILPARLGRIAEFLATGESTKDAAKRFRVSPGRVSQIRWELKDSWEEFQAEPQAELAVA